MECESIKQLIKPRISQKKIIIPIRFQKLDCNIVSKKIIYLIN